MNDMLNGQGRLIEFNEETGQIDIEYNGTFIDDKLSRHGEYLKSDGEKYTGQFFENLKHGQGRLLIPVEGNLLELGP